MSDWGWVHSRTLHTQKWRGLGSVRLSGSLGNQFYIFATHLLLPDSVANAANEQVGLIVISCLSVDATNQAGRPFFLDIN